MTRHLLAILLLAVPVSACDKGVDATKPSPGKDAGEAKGADPKQAEPSPLDVVACDEREFVSKLAQKMAETSGKPAQPARRCLDYSKHEGPLAPSCVDGVVLTTPCPRDGVVATCTYPNTHTEYLYYDGADLRRAESMCTVSEATFTRS